MNKIHTCAYRPTMHINEKRSPFQTEVEVRASDWPFCFSAFQSQSQYLVSGFLLCVLCIGPCQMDVFLQRALSSNELHLHNIYAPFPGVTVWLPHKTWCFTSLFALPVQVCLVFASHILCKKQSLVYIFMFKLN